MKRQTLSAAFGFLYRMLAVIAGGALSATAINLFFVPHSLLAGGLTGIAMILNHFLAAVPLWVFVAALNIPGIIVALRKLNVRFVLLSAIGVASYSFFIDMTQGWHLDIQNPIVSACFGAVLQGMGAALAMRVNGTLGGLDVISVLLSRKFSFPIGAMGIAFNAVVLGLSAWIFDVEIALLTLMAMFVAGRVVDTVLAGFNRCKTVLVVSDRHEEFAPILLEEMGRGITYLNGEGAYTGEARKICYCVVRTLELAKLKEIIRHVDENAFVTVIDTTEAMGGRGLDISGRFKSGA